MFAIRRAAELDGRWRCPRRSPLSRVMSLAAIANNRFPVPIAKSHIANRPRAGASLRPIAHHAGGSGPLRWQVLHHGPALSWGRTSATTPRDAELCAITSALCALHRRGHPTPGLRRLSAPHRLRERA